MGKLAGKIREEIEALLPPVIFFFVALHIVAIIRKLMLEGTGIPIGTSLTVTIGALILGKAVLIADLLPFINRYPDKPLIYNILWKTAIYTLVALLFHYAEHLIHFWRQTGDFAAANRKLLDEMVWAHFLAIQILLIVMILAYVTMREFTRLIGRHKVFEILFGKPPAMPESRDA